MKPMKPMIERRVRTAAFTFKLELDILDELAAEEPKPNPAPGVDSETALERVPETSEVSG